MNTTQPSTTTGLGTITLIDQDGDIRVLNVPDAGSDETVRLFLDSFKTRRIHMIGLPSAATITLNSKTLVEGKPAWWVKLKTTHALSHLDEDDMDAMINRNAPGTLIRNALGIEVLEKYKTATRDNLGEVIVKVSAFGKRQLAQPAVAPEHGD